MGRIIRRNLLIGAGVTAVVAAGGLAWRAADQGLLTAGDKRPGFAPWRDYASGRYRGPLALVAAGILAASPHNTQPWLFHIGADYIDVHAVLSRNLGAFDPFRREMFMSLGCAIENMLLAAPAQGLKATVSPIDGEPTRIARLVLVRQLGAVSPLGAAIPHRRTDRHPYEVKRPVPEDVITTLAAELGDPTVKLRTMQRGERPFEIFGAETILATQSIVADPDMDQWSHRWTRSSRAEVDRTLSGLTLEGAGLDRLTEIAGALLPPVSAASEGAFWLNLTRTVAIPTAGAFGMILVRDPYDKHQSLSAGRLWQRLHLRGVLLGLGMQPLNQIPELIDRERQLGRPPAAAERINALLMDKEWRPTFGFRLGYPTREPAVSPRRPVAEVVSVAQA